MSSVTIGGQAFRVVPWPKPDIKRAISWVMDGAKNWHGSDRTYTQDIYTSTVEFMDTEDRINALSGVLDSNQETVNLTVFNAPIFAPNLNQSGTVSCTHEVKSAKKRVHASGGTYDMYSMSVEFRAIGASVLGTTPSLSTLHIQEAITPDHSREIGRNYTKSGAQVYASYGNDTGILQARFSQRTAEMQAILAYLLTTARASTITLPTFPGLDYPFGYARGTGPFSAKVLDFDMTRKNLNRWDLAIDFAEVA